MGLIIKDETQKYYLLTDYISWRGGVNNVQRTRIVPVGSVWAYVKCVTSQVDNAERRAKAWAKKQNLAIERHHCGYF